MEPSNKSSSSGAELPLPAAESLPPAAKSAETLLPGLGIDPERPPVNAEKAAVLKPPAAAAPTSSTIPLPLTQPMPLSAVPAANDVAATTQNPLAAVDDDGDLIEKAWVEKAKQIVERNRDDPHKQSEELTVFKADYMKKRYGKTIKLSQ